MKGCCVMKRFKYVTQDARIKTLCSRYPNVCKKLVEQCKAACKSLAECRECFYPTQIAQIQDAIKKG